MWCSQVWTRAGDQPCSVARTVRSLGASGRCAIFMREDTGERRVTGKQPEG